MGSVSADPTERDAVARLAVQHVLSTMRLDSATTARLLADMTNPELEDLLRNVGVLAERIEHHLVARGARGCPACRSPGVRPLFPARCENPWHDEWERAHPKDGAAPEHDHSFRLDGAGCPACGYVTRSVPAGPDRHA